MMGLNVFDFSAVSMYEFEFAFAVSKKKPQLYNQLFKKPGAIFSDVICNSIYQDVFIIRKQGSLLRA